jgi:hypothetical protein
LFCHSSISFHKDFFFANFGWFCLFFHLRIDYIIRFVTKLSHFRLDAD